MLWGRSRPGTRQVRFLALARGARHNEFSDHYVPDGHGEAAGKGKHELGRPLYAAVWLGPGGR
jgi:hypothetical protein